MRAALFLVLVAVISSEAYSEPVAWTHVHAMSAPANHLLQLATGRSMVVRDLVAKIERSNVIVLFYLSSEPATETRRNFMTFVSAAGATRYVAIELYRTALPTCAYIPMLAHELQHVVELVAAPEVRDNQGCARLFASIGWETAPGRFETRGAKATEERVRQELGKTGRAH